MPNGLQLPQVIETATSYAVNMICHCHLLVEDNSKIADAGRWLNDSAITKSKGLSFNCSQL
jgi:hypothetical protein